MGDKPSAHYAHCHYPAGYFPQVVKHDTKSCIKLSGTPLKDFADFGKFGTCCYGGSSSTHGYLTTGHSLVLVVVLTTLCATLLIPASRRSLTLAPAYYLRSRGQPPSVEKFICLYKRKCTNVRFRVRGAASGALKMTKL